MKRRGSILIVEDNLHEQLLIKEAFHDLKVPEVVHTVSDGESAIAFLRGEEPYGDRQQYKFPTFMLVDLKMPKISGLELLLFLKRSNLIVIPTIVFTSSADADDVKTAYMLGANAFHCKPTQMEGLLRLLKSIYDYWSEVELPEVDGKYGKKLPAVVCRSKSAN